MCLWHTFMTEQDYHQIRSFSLHNMCIHDLLLPGCHQMNQCLKFSKDFPHSNSYLGIILAISVKCILKYMQIFNQNIYQMAALQIQK